MVNASGVSAPGAGVPLNTDEVKDAAALRWGDIRHPTVMEIAQMVLEGGDKWGRGDVVLWKMDVAGVFTLVWM